MFDENGVRGSYYEGNAVFQVTGARDVFKSRDAVAKERRKLLAPGTWTLAMNVTNAPSPSARGYGGFSVKVAKSGSATLSGTLPDGTAASYSGKAIIGDSDTYCIPVSVDSKKGGFGCCLWFKDGWLFNVSDIRFWTTTGKNVFAAGWRPIYSSVPGIGEIASTDGDPVVVARKVWSGTEVSMFRATMNAQKGALSGSMKFFVESTRGRVQSKSCKVSGVVVDGTAYCSVLSGKDGSFAVKVSSCDACED